MENNGTAPGCEKKHFGESWPARIGLPENNQKKQFHAAWRKKQFPIWICERERTFLEP